MEWAVISYSRESFQPKDRTRASYVSYIHRQVLYHCATWECLPRRKDPEKPQQVYIIISLMLPLKGTLEQTYIKERRIARTMWCRVWGQDLIPEVLSWAPVRVGVYGRQDIAKVWLTVGPLGLHNNLIDISPCDKFKFSNGHTLIRSRAGGQGWAGKVEISVIFKELNDQGAVAPKHLHLIHCSDPYRN